MAFLMLNKCIPDANSCQTGHRSRKARGQSILRWRPLGNGTQTHTGTYLLCYQLCCTRSRLEEGCWSNYYHRICPYLCNKMEIDNLSLKVSRLEIKNTFSSMDSKPINIHWIRTGSKPCTWKIMYRILL